MKIAFLSFFSGYVERGVENWTHEVAKRLSNAHNVVVFQNEPSETENYRTFSTGLNVNWKKKDQLETIWRRLFIDYWSLLIARWTLVNIFKIWRGNYDVVVPTNGGWQVAIIRILTWIRGKMVVVGHSGRGWDDRNNLYCFPDCFVALTRTNEKWAKKVNPFIRIENIPDGVNLDLFKPNGNKAHIDLKPPIVLAAGAPQQGKRLNLAIKAVSELGNASLLLLGAGRGERVVQKLGKRLLGKRFLMKKVPYKDMPKYYRSADVFTLPSWGNEAFGMVYLEAMACGVPVVATNDPIRKEIVGNAGVLVDPLDIKKYSGAIKKALNTSWHSKPRKQAQKFSWDIVATKYEALFEELVK